MKKNLKQNNSKKQNPILIGVISMLMIVILGAGIAFATGLTNPPASHADDGDDFSFSDPIEAPVDPSEPIDVSAGSYSDPVSVTSPTDYSAPSDPTDVTSPAPTDVTSPTTAPSDQTSSSDIQDDPSGGSDPIISDTPDQSDNNLSPCCTDETTPTDIQDDSSGGSAPIISDTPDESDNNLSPCCEEDTTPPQETPPVDTPPVDVPPVVVTPTPPPVIVPTPPTVYTCPSGDTGTYPDCVPPVIVVPPPVIVTPPSTPVCATGDTGTYPNCVPPVVVVPPVIIPPVTGCTENCQTGGGGGGGGTSGQIVTTYGGGGGGTSGQIVPLPQAPVASMVYLSQIPYTGLDLGPVGTVVYWVLLVLICAAAAYLILFQLIPWVIKLIQSFGKDVGHAINQPAVGMALAGGHVSATGASHEPTPAQQTHVVHATTTVSKPNPSAYSAAQGFSSFAQNGSLTIDDIVNGLARLPEVESHQATSAPVEVTQTTHTEATIAPAPAAQIQAPQAFVQPTAQPAPAVSTDVRDFCAALLQGNRDVVFATIRQVVREGGDAEMFITQVVCAFDDAYRNRVEGTKVNAEIAQLTQNCATPFLERLMNALTNAVDSSYSPGISGSKLALTRALAVVEG